MPDFQPSPAARFPTTQWSRVVAAGGPDSGAALAALDELCQAYWYPIYALVRHKGHDPDAALDLTQDYFARLLEKGIVGAADPNKGRFRAFLRTDCGFFLADHRERERAQKRGGEAARVSIDVRDAEGRYLYEPADGLTAELLFDRAWAMTFLDRVLDKLAADHAAAGKAVQFDVLKVVLTDGTGSVPYSALAEQLGMSEAAVQQAIRRLRLRYRETLRELIAATLDQPSEAEVDDEVRALFETFGA